MLKKTLLAFGLGAVTAAAVLPGASIGQDMHKPIPAASGKHFREGCAGCHTIPDQSYKTDGAWIHRLKVTA